MEDVPKVPPVQKVEDSTPSVESVSSIPSEPSQVEPVLVKTTGGRQRIIGKGERIERRQKVREMMAKGVYYRYQMAEILNVDVKTITNDMQHIRNEQKSRLSRKEGPNHLADIVGNMEEIGKSAMLETMSLPKGSSRSGTVKAALWQTALRAAMAKAQILQQTGIIPTDITAADKMLEAEVIQKRTVEAFDQRLAGVATRPESRRKVLDYISSLENLSPEVRQREIEEIEQTLRTRDIGTPEGEAQ